MSESWSLLVLDLTRFLTHPTFIAGVVSLLLVLAGISVIKNMKKDSPMEPYLLQILGLLFIVPVVTLLAIVLKLESEAVTGILGTIVGYIFGTSTIQRNSPPNNAIDESSASKVQHDSETEDREANK